MVAYDLHGDYVNEIGQTPNATAPIDTRRLWRAVCESTEVRFRRRNRSGADPREVEDAMDAVAAADNAETRAALFRAMLNTTLVAATPDAPTEERAWIAREGDQIDLVMLDTEDGPVLPVFTSVDRLLEWQPEGSGYVALPSRAFFEMVAASGAVRLDVNPGSTTRGTIERDELAALARGRMPLGETEVVAAETEVRIGRPAEPPPDDVVAAVRRAVASEDRAVGAWIFLMQQGGSAPEHVVGVVLSAGMTADAERAAIRKIVEDAGGETPGARELVFMRVDENFQRDLANGAGDLIFAR